MPAFRTPAGTEITVGDELGAELLAQGYTSIPEKPFSAGVGADTSGEPDVTSPVTTDDLAPPLRRTRKAAAK